MIKLNVQFEKPFEPFGQTEVSSIINAISAELKLPDYIINVKLVDKSKVQKLNKLYGSKDEPTDVLSFNYTENDTTNSRVQKQADVVISFQHVEKQAKEAKTNKETEMALLILHGILHILGHDHQDKAEVEQVDRLQSRIMKRAGLEYRNFGWKS